MEKFMQLGIRPFAVDIAVLLILFVFAKVHQRKGLSGTVLPVVIVVVSVAAGFIGSNLLMPSLKPVVWEKVETRVEAYYDEKLGTTIEDTTKPIESVKESLQSLSEKFDLNIGEGSEDASPEVLQEAGMNDKIKEVVMLKAELITERILKTALFIAIALLSMLILRLFTRHRGKKERKTVVGKLDAFAGFIFGAIEGLVIMFAVTRVCGLVHVDFFNELAEGTRILSWINGGSIQQAMQQLQQLDFEAIKKLDLEDIKNFDVRSIGEKIGGLTEKIKGTFK